MHWFEGRRSQDGRLPFDLADRGLTLGDGVFDTALVLRGRMVWRQAHVARLAQACASFGFALDHAAVDAAIDALIPGVARGALRVTVTRGSGPRGLRPPQPASPRIFASVAPLRADPFTPLSLTVSTIRRNETSPTARSKTLGYLDAVVAGQVAAEAGFDDALFLNTRGHVACSTVGNIVALMGGSLVTPPLTDGVLAGMARAALLRLAPALGLQPEERSLTLADLARAEAVLVTNSLKLLAPVRAVGDRQHPPETATVATLRAALRDAIRNDCGADPCEQT